jgi:hypothetical protein
MMSDTTQGIDEILAKKLSVLGVEYRDDGQKQYSIDVAPLKQAILQWVADEVVGENLLLNTDPHIGQDIHNAIKAKQRYILTQHGWKQNTKEGTE